MAIERLRKVNVRELRHKTGLNQTDFWTLVGVTQSAGSRYESGREIPDSAMLLIGHVYLNERITPHRWRR